MGWSGDFGAHNVKISSEWGCMVSFTCHLLYPWGQWPHYLLNWKLGRPQCRSVSSLQIQLGTDLVFHPGDCHGQDMGLKKQRPFYDLALFVRLALHPLRISTVQSTN